MIHVRLQNRLLDNKTSVRAVIPLFIWVIVLIGTLLIMFATSFYWLVLVLGIEFLCIIPVFFICKSRINKAFSTLDGIFYEADLEVKDKKLYYGNTELYIEHDKKTGTVSLKHEMVAGKYQATALSFWSIVCDEDKETFLKTCEFYNLEITR